MNTIREGEGEGNPHIEVSEEEIEKRIRIARMKERLMQQLQRIQEEEKQLTEKVESAKEAIFREMKERYSLTEEEFRDAFRDIQQKKEIEQRIMETIREKGKEAFKEIKDDMERIRRTAIIEGMDEKDIKKIAVYIKEAQAFIEEKMTEEGKRQIHHKGRLHEETIKIMRKLKEQGGRMNERECLEWAKEELQINSDTFNKRRYSLFIRGYAERDGPDLVLTPLGHARLAGEKEEGL